MSCKQQLAKQISYLSSYAKAKFTKHWSCDLGHGLKKRKKFVIWNVTEMWWQKCGGNMIVRFRRGNMAETRPVHGQLDHHVSAGRKRDGYKQLPVSVEFTKYGNTLFRPVPGPRLTSLLYLGYITYILGKGGYSIPQTLLNQHILLRFPPS